MTAPARPFESLGLKPFLFADDSAQTEIRQAFHKKLREFHPDRFARASQDERARAEALSSELNADYARLRDPWRLIETVLESAAANALPAERRGPPPELATEYFELQESWADKGPAGARDEAQDFADKVRAKAQVAETAVLALAKQFPFAGFGPTTPARWSIDDLAQLATAMNQLRYYRSFERDLRNKFLSSPG